MHKTDSCRLKSLHILLSTTASMFLLSLSYYLLKWWKCSCQNCSVSSRPPTSQMFSPPPKSFSLACGVQSKQFNKVLPLSYFYYYLNLQKASTDRYVYPIAFRGGLICAHLFHILEIKLRLEFFVLFLFVNYKKYKKINVIVCKDVCLYHTS